MHGHVFRIDVRNDAAGLQPGDRPPYINLRQTEFLGNTRPGNPRVSADGEGRQDLDGPLPDELLQEQMDGPFQGRPDGNLTRPLAATEGRQGYGQPWTTASLFH